MANGDFSNLPAILTVLVSDGNWHNVGELRTFYPRVGWKYIRSALVIQHNAGTIQYDTQNERFRKGGE